MEVITFELTQPFPLSACGLIVKDLALHEQTKPKRYKGKLIKQRLQPQFVGSLTFDVLFAKLRHRTYRYH